jgi:hypothetical protein
LFFFVFLSCAIWSVSAFGPQTPPGFTRSAGLAAWTAQPFLARLGLLYLQQEPSAGALAPIWPSPTQEIFLLITENSLRASATLLSLDQICIASQPNQEFIKQNV